MSNFLVNLARRGAGLPATKIQAPPPLPFGPEIRQHGDELAETPRAGDGPRMAEEFAADNAESQAFLPASSAEEISELPSETAIDPTPSIQRISRPESVQPSIAAPAISLPTPSLWPPQPSGRHAISHMREAEADFTEPLERFELAVPPVHTGREVTTAIRVAPDIPSLIMTQGERQVSPAERSPKWPRLGAQETRAQAMRGSTIRPALADSPNLLQFPKLATASSPTPPSQLPIHVRIGRVEVRATTAPASTPPGPGSPAPLGFDGYYRVRNYRG
jgi:hypothetical protein